ncbi:YfhO family protein [Streptomyces cylindrosporus]|uniref:YfhO family protein n=1 Tax=Streptomyces cylindrosporus TaxID=2927583 RepID=A0ABS9YF08_9ACTN|nr:YfhO family protein [Streptomyces cylindrosporus]MCI3275822.1 YfhO family protein [Streptomyces cylindrosporus]
MDRSTLSKAVSSGHFSPKRAAAVLAAVLTGAVFCAADALAGSYPFGSRTRDVNDLGNQYVPFHAHLWDLLHGRAHGGLFVNWQSGFGSSFLPDVGTYLGSPFALLVGVFPRDEIDLAVYVITVLKTASAGAAMAWLLLVLRRGRWWGAGLLGTSYALCGWSLAVASYNPMWLDGLLALPLLCLVGEWTLRRRRPLLGVLIVALAWIANFYTAYMATLAAGLVLLLRLWLSGLSNRQRLRTAGRAALTVALGVGLAAPLVTVVYFGTKHAYPGRVVDFRPVPTEDLLARLLPTTYSFGSPAVYAGTAALLLALALPFHRAVPRRTRVGWTVLVAAVALSLQWGPTHLVWHAFATPQGSPYRQAFVLCGLLVIAAWQSLSYGPPDLRALGAAGALLTLIAAAASRSALVHHVTWAVFGLAVVGAAGGLALLRHATAEGAASAGQVTDVGHVTDVGRTPGGERRLEAGPRFDAGPRFEGAPRFDGELRSGAETRLDGEPRSDSGPSLDGEACSGAGLRSDGGARSGSGLRSDGEPRSGSGLRSDGEACSGSGLRFDGEVCSDSGPNPDGEPRSVSGLSPDGEARSGARPRSDSSPTPARRRRTVLVGLALLLLFGGQFGEAMATSAQASRLRLDHMDDYAPWGERQQEQADVIARADGWPRYRTDPGREQTVANDPMVVGGEGAQYYSSLTSDVLSRTLSALGGGWTSRGRSLQSLDNPVTDAVFSIGARVHSPPDPHQNWFAQDGSRPTVTRQDVPPLVTVRPSTATPSRWGPSPYRNQELLLGARVYTVPRITIRTGTGKPPTAGNAAHPGLLVPAGTGKPTITATCPAGNEVYLWAPHFSGTARTADGATGRFRSDALVTKIAAMQRLGTVPPSGKLRIELTPNRDSRVPQGAVGCLDTARLHTAVEHLKATGATRVSVDDATVKAQLPAGSKGVAVIAAPRIAGWRCAAGDATAVPAKAYHGLIAVPLDGSANSLTCTFHPPGLRLGATVGGASLLTLGLLGVLTAVRRRRTPHAPAPTTTPARPLERVTGAR